MNRLQFKMMMEGLITTVIEKICVLGFEDSKEDVKKIIDMIEELDMFWNQDEDLIEMDWMEEISATVETLKTRIG